ncbi:MAG: DHH family phosphoesterase, partial [Erysipelotrichaceae bacterium]|nr:DHH family phosphoesterase [Erysipelotrichaceae bacterium]
IMKNDRRLKLIMAIGILVIGLVMFILNYIFHLELWFALLVYLLMVALMVAVVLYIDTSRQEMRKDIENNLDEGMRDTLEDAGVGILVYNDNYEITWMSSLLVERSMNHVGEKIFNWLPEIQNLIDGSTDEELIIINEEKYNVTKKKNANVLSFRDISKEYDLNKLYSQEATVLGILNFDNYDDVSELEDDLAYFNTNIRPLVYEYFKEHNLVYKTLRNNRVMLVLDEQRFAELVADRFSILQTVKREAKKGDTEMTLSMAFARGSSDLQELDQMATSLLEIAQTRGGDQVVARKVNEEAVFYGSSSDTKGRRSNVRARVIANTLKNLLEESSNAIIVGHNEADSDCIGAALCMSLIARTYVDDVVIVARTGGIEPTVAAVLKDHQKEFEERHRFVTEAEAINRLRDDTLVIMVDHHMAAQSNGMMLLKEAKRVVIIDHHRRRADLDTKPLLVYIEVAASSACEVCAEFLPYLLKRSVPNALEANMMYFGILIDTHRFRVRTGERTFNVAATLRQYGADPTVVEEWNRKSFDTMKKITKIINQAKLLNNNVVVAAMNDDEIYSRTVISQACDDMLGTREISAGFVIAHTSEEEMAISARSDGTINVQLIMEKMHGGGHLTGAGVQRKEGTIDSLREELEAAVRSYLAEESDKDESYIVG